MIEKDTYLSISDNSEGLYKDKGSRFIALAFYVENENNVKKILQELKKKYYNARHHCYAYRIGYTGEIFRSNDDGEPSGTAGKPILGQLLSKDLTNILVVVVRYFGGVKLGTSGLINAYKNATIDAINNANIVEKIIELSFVAKFNYEEMNIVMKLLKDSEANIKENNYSDNKCLIKFNIRKAMANKLVSNLISNNINIQQV